MKRCWKNAEKNTPFQGPLKIFSGSANPDLAKKIVTCLNPALGKVLLKRFSDGEFHTGYEESIRGADVFIVQPTNQPDGNFVELLVMIDAAKRASAGRITAVIPYFGYARSDRKVGPRTPIAAKVMANMIERAGANRVLAMDFHAAQIEGFFDIQVDHIYAKPVLVNKFNKKYKNDIGNRNFIIVAPDGGATNMARAYAKKVGNVSIAIIDKRRPEPNKSEILNIIFTGDLRGKIALLIDDMVDTAGSMINAATALLEAGVARVDAACTHAVLSGKAVENLQNSSISNMLVTDTIAIPSSKLIDKIKVISISRLLAKAIQEIHEQGSVSKLFED